MTRGGGMAAVFQPTENEDFFKIYKAYTERQESPTCFHFWTSVGILSGAVGRSLWLDRGRYILYPNHYIILVSDSALCRKSSALNIGIELLREALDGQRDAITVGLPVILSAKMTPEALCRAISRKGLKDLEGLDIDIPERVSRPVILHSSELGVFMSKSAQMNGLVDLLMDFYDCPNVWEYVTKTQGTDIVYNVYACLLAATTPGWISDNVTSSVFNQGLVGRTIFVYSNTPAHKEPFPYLTDQEKVYQQWLIDALQRYSTMSGPLTMDTYATKYFAEWYQEREEPVGTSQLNSGFFGREHDHVLKLATLLAIGRAHHPIITAIDIEDAIESMDTLKYGLENIFREVTADREIYEVKIVEGVIREKIEINRTNLLKRVYRKMNKDKLDECLGSLIGAGVVEAIETPAGKRGRTGVKYRLKS